MIANCKAKLNAFCRCCILALMLSVYVGYPAWMLYLHRDAVNSTGAIRSTASTTPPLEEVVIEGPSGRWRKWDRNEAVKFSFEQTDTQITLFLAAAAAVVAAIAKMTLDSVRGEPGKIIPLTKAQIKCATCICAACGWSLFFGVQAKSLFSRVADAPKFSIYAELGVFAMNQIAWFFVGLAILVVALMRAAWNASAQRI